MYRLINNQLMYRLINNQLMYKLINNQLIPSTFTLKNVGEISRCRLL